MRRWRFTRGREGDVIGFLSRSRKNDQPQRPCFRGPLPVAVSSAFFSDKVGCGYVATDSRSRDQWILAGVPGSSLLVRLERTPGCSAGSLTRVVFGIRHAVQVGLEFGYLQRNQNIAMLQVISLRDPLAPFEIVTRAPGILPGDLQGAYLPVERGPLDRGQCRKSVCDPADAARLSIMGFLGMARMCNRRGCSYNSAGRYMLPG